LLGGISSLERREVRTNHVENSEIAALYQNTFLPSQHVEQKKHFTFWHGSLIAGNTFQYTESLTLKIYL